MIYGAQARHATGVGDTPESVVVTGVLTIKLVKPAASV